jgi:hypothetical protein
MPQAAYILAFSLIYFFSPSFFVRKLASLIDDDILAACFIIVRSRS